MLLKTPAGLEFQFGMPSQTPPEDTLRCHQIHSADILEIEKQERDQLHHFKADGLFSSTPSTCLGVQTADCIPALFYSTNEAKDINHIAAVHAGWQGLLSGILPNTVELFKNKLRSSKALHVLLGPSIRQCCFEVSPDFVENFENKWQSLFIEKKTPLLQTEERKTCTEHPSQSHLWFNLLEFARRQLVQAGMSDENILITAQCTYCAVTKSGSFLYASHRRSTHLKLNPEKASKLKTPLRERQLSWIKWNS